MTLGIPLQESSISQTIKLLPLNARIPAQSRLYWHESTRWKRFTKTFRWNSKRLQPPQRNSTRTLPSVSEVDILSEIIVQNLTDHQCAAMSSMKTEFEVIFSGFSHPFPRDNRNPPQLLPHQYQCQLFPLQFQGLLNHKSLLYLWNLITILTVLQPQPLPLLPWAVHPLSIQETLLDLPEVVPPMSNFPTEEVSRFTGRYVPSLPSTFRH